MTKPATRVWSGLGAAVQTLDLGNDPVSVAPLVATVSVDSTGTPTSGSNPSSSQPRPIAVGALGAYRITRRFVPPNSTAAAAVLYACRWHPTGGSALMVLTRARIQALQIGAPTAAIEARASLWHAQSYTVSETTHGPAIGPAAGKQKLRTSMGDSLAIIQETDNSAGATGGTSTLDTNPIAQGAAWMTAALGTAATAGMQTLFDYNPLAVNEYPLVLANNEGFQILNDAVLAAAVNFAYYVELAWTETQSY